MLDGSLAEVAAEAAQQVLVWVGFGTLVGLAAKGIMPGKDPGGAVGTTMMGIAGSVIGCGCLMFFYDKGRVSPISPIGFVVATAGAFLLLFFYRLLAGSFFTEAETGDTWFHRYRRRRRRYRMVDDA